jgi:hypothetical protein
MQYAGTIIRYFKYELIKVVSFLLLFVVTLVLVVNESNRIYESNKYKNKRVILQNTNEIGFEKDLKEENRN